MRSTTQKIVTVTLAFAIAAQTVWAHAQPNGPAIPDSVSLDTESQPLPQLSPLPPGLRLPNACLRCRPAML